MSYLKPRILARPSKTSMEKPLYLLGWPRIFSATITKGSSCLKTCGQYITDNGNAGECGRRCERDTDSEGSDKSFGVVNEIRADGTRTVAPGQTAGRSGRGASPSDSVLAKIPSPQKHAARRNAERDSGLQIAFLRVTEQGRDAMVVPHTANIGVPPQWKDLTNDGHPPQRAVNQLHDVRITHFLNMKTTEGL
ncbi:hypothetical protein EYF80_020129 [Liparis tanakae]|uniref:Uncharacterized protein n=1 Tax=Liparis tanakae TaxID=230148 RepID=A0A4Z2HUY8_9TELE|nr:hypothetical protein EYF80_020129 [Liparis tanakae]